jgi:branched-chain amino acid transport system substrate-binding protein
MVQRHQPRVRFGWALGVCFLASMLMPVAVAGPASAQKASGEPILLGNVALYSQPGFNGQPVGKLALQAWQKWVNAHGGVNGHPVKIIIRDNHGDQAQAVSQVKDLVENEHVIAFISNQDGSLNGGYADYLKEKGIPVLGGNVFTLEPWISNPMFFSQGLTAIPTITAIVDSAKAAGHKRIGSLACAEAAQCAAANALIENLAKKGGIQDVYKGLVSSTAPDYTANCLAAKNAKADAIVLLIATADQGKKIADDCARQDYKPAWILPGEAIGAGYLDSANFNGAINAAPVQPWFSKDKSMKDFHAAIKKYTDIDFDTADLPLNAVDAWVDGLMLQRAVELSGATGAPTTADILNGLAKFDHETLGGMAGGLTFTNPAKKDQYCYFTIIIKKQKFTLPNGATPKCVAPS